VTTFAFGANWARYLRGLDEQRIAEAEASLRAMLGDLDGLSFLDIGSGSGLFSLAAARLGAERVHSFDADPESVACTLRLRGRHPGWTVERGSALDAEYMRSLGRFDVVYAWGVLHHTGDLWAALAHAVEAVDDGGRLFVSIYNDQGRRSRMWRSIKRTYNTLPPRARVPYAVAVMAPREALSAAIATARGRPQAYVRSWTGRRDRGMSRWHDLLDWVGGYPFEVARPEQVFDFVHARGLTLERLTTCGGGLGCNQFVFARDH
jgi:2-polyprenyl-6-hydroxyphenyl methylase/3-demethylubiquinone-9 3-methyltransferase